MLHGEKTLGFTFSWACCPSVWRCSDPAHGRLMLVCSAGSVLILIGLEVGDHTPKDVSVSLTIEGLDLDRSGDDSGRKKRQNQDRRKHSGQGKRITMAMLDL